MNDKRKEHRLKAVLPVSLSDGKNLDAAAWTTNISRLGAYVESKQQITVGAAVQAAVSIPAYESAAAGEARLKATVFRCSPLPGQTGFGLGLFFTGFKSRQDQSRLSEYIEYLVRREELGVKEELKRRRAGRPQEQGLPQEDAVNQCLELLRDISRRLDDLAAQVGSLKKK